DHASTAAPAWRTKVLQLVGVAWVRRRDDIQEFAGERETGLAGRASQQAVMPDAMKAAWQDMKQEAADELVGRKRHHLLSVRAVAAVVVVAEGDAALVEDDQPAVRDRDPVGVARQVGQHRCRAGEWRLGI